MSFEKGSSIKSEKLIFFYVNWSWNLRSLKKQVLDLLKRLEKSLPFWMISFHSNNICNGTYSGGYCWFKEPCLCCKVDFFIKKGRRIKSYILPQMRASLSIPEGYQLASEIRASKSNVCFLKCKSWRSFDLMYISFWLSGRFTHYLIWRLSLVVLGSSEDFIVTKITFTF